MLVIYKGNIVLRVQYGEGAVWIQPVKGPFDSVTLLTALARNEELMAQAHLNLQANPDTPTQLAAYFRQKGWLVKLPGHQEPQA